MGYRTHPAIAIVSCTPQVWCFQDLATNERSNSFLIVGSERALLFDAGVGIANLQGLIGDITDKPCRVVLSHWHHDHSGGAHFFTTVHAWKSAMTRQLQTAGISSESINQLSGPAYAEAAGPVQPLTQLQLVEKESTFNLGDLQVQLIYTPGHTQDSVCLYEPTKGWLFTGDTVYPGPLYLDLPDSNRSLYLQSLDRLRHLQPKVVFPGHNVAMQTAQAITDCATVAIMENE